MNTFSKEPHRMVAEQARIEHEIIEVAVAQHEAFTHSNEVSQVVAVQVNKARMAARRATDRLANLQEKCEKFSQHGKQWRMDTRSATTTVTNYPKLMEILDAPTTLDLCLRNEMYHEGLLVLEHVSSFAQQNEHDEVLKGIQEQCVSTMQKALHQIITTKLCGSLMVSQTMKTVKFLHQMAIPPKQVRQLFVEQRSVFINQLIAEASALATSPYFFLSKLLSIFKVHVAEVVAHYKACFGPGSTLTGAAPASPSSKTAGGSTNVLPFALRDELHAACQGWISQLVSEFEKGVPLITSSTEIRSLAEQCGHTEVVLSREGLDVGPLLLTQLAGRTESLFCEYLDSALTHFRVSLDAMSWREDDTNRLRRNSSSTTELSGKDSDSALKASGGGKNGTSAADVSFSADEDRSPPLQLLNFPPLAHALNELLTGFNEIRKSIAVSSVPACLSKLRAVFNGMVSLTLAVAPAGEAHTLPKLFKQFVSGFNEGFGAHVVWATAKLLGAEYFTLLQEMFADCVAPLLAKVYVPPAPASTSERSSSATATAPTASQPTLSAATELPGGGAYAAHPQPDPSEEGQKQAISVQPLQPAPSKPDDQTVIAPPQQPPRPPAAASTEALDDWGTLGAGSGSGAASPVDGAAAGSTSSGGGGGRMSASPKPKLKGKKLD